MIITPDTKKNLERKEDIKYNIKLFLVLLTLCFLVIIFDFFLYFFTKPANAQEYQTVYDTFTASTTLQGNTRLEGLRTYGQPQRWYQDSIFQAIDGRLITNDVNYIRVCSLSAYVRLTNSYTPILENPDEIQIDIWDITGQEDEEITYSVMNRIGYELVLSLVGEATISQSLLGVRTSTAWGGWKPVTTSFDQCFLLVKDHKYLMRLSRKYPCRSPYTSCSALPEMSGPQVEDFGYEFMTNLDTPTVEDFAMTFGDSNMEGNTYANGVAQSYVFADFDGFPSAYHKPALAIQLYGQAFVRDPSGIFENSTSTSFQDQDFGTLGNYFKNLFIWLFMPREEKIEAWKDETVSIGYKMPWGYLLLLNDDIEDWNIGNTTTHLTFDFSVPSMPSLATTTLDVTQYYLDVPQEARDFSRVWFVRIIWAEFLIYVIIRALSFKE